ncbi:hypothetical protein CON91_33345, partial [Bacillus wiedmannii]
MYRVSLKTITTMKSQRYGRGIIMSISIIMMG